MSRLRCILRGARGRSATVCWQQAFRHQIPFQDCNREVPQRRNAAAALCEVIGFGLLLILVLVHTVWAGLSVFTAKCLICRTFQEVWLIPTGAKVSDTELRLETQTGQTLDLKIDNFTSTVIVQECLWSDQEASFRL